MEDIDLIMLDINQDNKIQIQNYLTNLRKNQKDPSLSLNSNDNLAKLY